MDKHKIYYQCTKSPGEYFGVISGFEENNTYEGRSFNGLFEISPAWGRYKYTKVISGQDFKKFFKLVTKKGEVDISLELINTGEA